MSTPNHYETLQLDITATPTEIKTAYRRLVKLFHPDSRSNFADPEATIRINAAYEVLSDPQKRQYYDKSLRSASPAYRQQRTATGQQHHRQQRQAQTNPDEAHQRWLAQVYAPVSRWLCLILNPLAEQLDQLAADPFDDDLMAEFQTYLEDCRNYLKQAQQTFRSQPNPSSAAGAALHLYYCLNQVADGLEELQIFTLNYDDSYLHAGQEMFRIAVGLHCEARHAAQSAVSSRR